MFCRLSCQIFFAACSFPCSCFSCFHILLQFVILLILTSYLFFSFNFSDLTVSAKNLSAYLPYFASFEKTIACFPPDRTKRLKSQKRVYSSHFFMSTFLFRLIIAFEFSMKAIKCVMGVFFLTLELHSRQQFRDR